MLSNLEVAKSKMALHCPEFISLLHKLEIEPRTNLPTAATNGRQLFYNPTWFDTLTINETAAVLMHEIAHNMQAHPARMKPKYDGNRANYAMDIVMNQMLQSYFDEIKSKNVGFAPCLPAIAIQGPEFDKYRGWNWEKVYYDLEKSNKGKPIKGMDEVQPGVNADGSPQNAAQAEALAQEWQMAAQQAANIAKRRGMQSSFFESFVRGLTATKVDWLSQVWDVCTKVAKEDQSYRRFNRKLISRKIYLPGWYSEKMGNVVIATDTSGSMSNDNFKLALSAINEIMETLKPEKIWSVCCDTEIKSVEELTVDDLPIQAKPFKGRGGTALTPIFKWIKEQYDEPELVVVLTDGECEKMDKKWEPSCPVVWLVCGGDKGKNLTFGRVIKVG